MDLKAEAEKLILEGLQTLIEDQTDLEPEEIQQWFKDVDVISRFDGQIENIVDEIQEDHS